MKRPYALRAVCACCCFFILFLSTAAATRAEDVNALLKQVNSELRISQRDMFSGKLDNAVASLENIEALLASVKTEDPDHPERKKAENKYTKLLKDLERRTGKRLGGGTTTAGSGETVHASPDTRAAEKSPPVSTGQGNDAAVSAEFEADVRALKAEYDRHAAVFEKAAGKPIFYYELKPVEELLGLIDEFEQNEMAAVKEKAAIFGRKYGTGKEEIDQKAESMGYSGKFYSAGYPYDELIQALANIPKTRMAMAEDLARKADKMVFDNSKGHDFVRLQQYEKARTWLAMAFRFDAGNALVQRTAESVDRKIADSMKDLYAKIDKQTFPGQAADAPPEAEDLTRTVLKWFDEHPVWGNRAQNPYTVLKVVITGPWLIQKRNILAESIMYGLPAALAIQLEEEKEKGLVRVFNLIMLTEEMKGVAKGPPFHTAIVSSSYYLHPSKL